MLQLLEDSKEDIVAFRLTGDVDKRDYDVMLPLLEEKIRQYGKIRVFADVQGVEDLSLRALWDEIRFDFKHATNFKKAAIVGDRKWLDWLTVMASPFTTAKVKYFEPEQRMHALNWIKADG